VRIEWDIAWRGIPRRGYAPIARSRSRVTVDCRSMRDAVESDKRTSQHDDHGLRPATHGIASLRRQHRGQARVGRRAPRCRVPVRLAPSAPIEIRSTREGFRASFSSRIPDARSLSLHLSGVKKEPGLALKRSRARHASGMAAQWDSRRSSFCVYRSQPARRCITGPREREDRGCFSCRLGGFGRRFRHNFGTDPNGPPLAPFATRASGGNWPIPQPPRSRGKASGARKQEGPPRNTEDGPVRRG
jgi:hypothetical protein